MHSRHYPIKESHFLAVIEPLILAHKKPAGRPPKSSNYKAFCGILYILRTGIPWRYLPPCFGK